MKKLLAGFILLTLCLEIPFQGSNYDMGRVWGLRIGVIILWLVTLSLLWVKEINFRKRQSIKGLIILLILWSAWGWISLLQGSDPWKSLWGNPLRGDGYLTFLAFGAFSMWLGFFWEKKWEEVFSWLMVAGGVVMVVFQVSNCLTLTNLDCGGWMGNPVLLAGFLVMVVLFWGRLLSKAMKKERLLLLMIGILLMWGLLLTGAWIGILGLFLLGIHYLGLKTKAILMITVIFLLAAGIAWQQYEASLGFVAESRQRIWIKGIQGALKRPVLGWGSANFDYAFEAIDWPVHFNDDVVVDKAHNELLEQLVSGGIVGLLFYLVAWGFIFTKIMQKKDDRAFYFLICLVYWIVVSVNVVPIGVQLIFWWLLGTQLVRSQ